MQLCSSVFGPPESGSIRQRSGSGPFSEIILAKQDFNTKYKQKIKFLRLKIMCLWLSYKKKILEKIFFCILKVTEERSRIRIH
jgi:hypothetical protein